MLLSVGLRCWLGRQSCWLFRLRPTLFGTYLCPNFSFAWVCVLEGGSQQPSMTD
jgi:hypothetical protein